MRAGALPLLLAMAAAPALGQSPGKPLFSDDRPLALTLDGPIRSLTRDRTGQGGPGRLTVAGSAPLAVMLSPRGNFRRQRGTCDFPPIRVTFTAPPPIGSPFAGQKKLKLVTNCKRGLGNKTLLEYAAYRMFNALTERSFRVRLAQINYAEGGQLAGSFPGFFIEDDSDVGRRIGLVQARRGSRVPVTMLDPSAAGRMAMFEYMIANLDWSQTAAAEGEKCCHNGVLFAAGQSASAALSPIPYDFDFSGLVNAPYATPPDAIPVKSVRSRVFRGYCFHNGGALAAARDMRTRQAAVMAAIDVPGLDPREAGRARQFITEFFAEIADDQSVQQRILSRCLK